MFSKKLRIEPVSLNAKNSWNLKNTGGYNLVMLVSRQVGYI